MSSWACRCWKLHFCNLSLSHQSSLLCSTERTALTLFYTLGYSTEASLKKCTSNSKLTKFCLLRPSFSPYFTEMSVARSNLNWQTFLSYFLWDDPPLMEANRFSDPLYQPSASMSQADVLICIQMFPLHLFAAKLCYTFPYLRSWLQSQTEALDLHNRPVFHCCSVAGCGLGLFNGCMPYSSKCNA